MNISIFIPITYQLKVIHEFLEQPYGQTQKKYEGFSKHTYKKLREVQKKLFINYKNDLLFAPEEINEQRLKIAFSTLNFTFTFKLAEKLIQESYEDIKFFFKNIKRIAKKPLPVNSILMSKIFTYKDNIESREKKSIDELYHLLKIKDKKTKDIGDYKIYFIHKRFIEGPIFLFFLGKKDFEIFFENTFEQKIIEIDKLKILKSERVLGVEDIKGLLSDFMAGKYYQTLEEKLLYKFNNLIK